MAEFNPYGGNYAAFSQGLKQNLDRHQQEQQRMIENQRQAERMAMEKARQEQDMAYRQEQILNMKIQQNKQLMVPADSGIKPLDAYLNTASRQVVDQAAKLKTEVANGEISADDYALRMAQIQNQIPQLQTFKDTFTKNVANYTDALAAGTLSNAMAPGTDAFYKALREGGGDFTLGLDPETNEVTMVGTSADGEEVRIPMSSIGQMPAPIVKQPAPWETLKPTMEALAVGNPSWNAETEEQANVAFDQLMAGGKDAMMSIAVDWYGMPYEEAEELYLAAQDPNATDATVLGEKLREKWLETARTQFKGSRLAIREQELQNALKEKALSAEPKTGNMTVAAIKQNAAQAQYEKLGAITDQAQQIFDQGDTDKALQYMKKWLPYEITQEAAIDQPEDKRGTWGKFAPTWAGGEEAPEEVMEFVARDDKGNVVAVGRTPAELQQQIAASAINPGAALQFASPVNRLSPLDRGRAASKARENERTKAALEEKRQARSAELDQQRQDEKVGWGDIAQAAAGGIPYVGGALAAKDIGTAVAGAAKGGAKKAVGAVGKTLAGYSAGSDAGAAGDFVSAADDAAGAFGKTIGKGLGAAASAAGIVGAADAAYQAGKLYNKKMVQDMTPEQYENYKRTGSTSGRRRAPRRR